MTSYSLGIPRTTAGIPQSNGPQIKSPKIMDVLENNATDYSIFVGYGAKAKRVKDRWEATKRLLRFENNYVALKWLLDSFVDEYLRSKQMNDTVAMTAEVGRKERRPKETSVLAYGRRTAVRSPPKTRFEEVSNERNEPITTTNKSITTTTLKEPRTVITANEQRPKPANEVVRPVTSGEKRYTHNPAHYSYHKYLPEYWPPYYWSGNMPVSPRLMNVTSIPGYPCYMVKTSSCSSLPTREPQSGGDHLKRWGSATVVNEEKEAEEKQSKRSTVKLGFKTKSMPNLQFIPKDGECISEDEDEDESDPESQGDLVALSSSSLSMPNLHRIQGDRTPLLSPPAPVTGRRYEPLLRDRHDIGPTSSFSMPNLQTIHGVRDDDRKKTIREFVVNRLTRSDDEPDGVKTKIFNPNGYFMSSRSHDPDNKRVKQDIRRRLLQRIEAKRQIQETHGDMLVRKNDKLTPHLKTVGKLPKISENRILGKNTLGTSVARGESLGIGKDHNGNNNWKIPVSVVGHSEPSRLIKGISWDDNQIKRKLSSPESRIWNPADVHVKKENLSDGSVDEEEVNNTATTAAAAATNGSLPQSSTIVEAKNDEKEASSPKEEGTKEGTSEEDDDDEDDDENIDVEKVDKDAKMEDSCDSDGEFDDDMGPDGKGTKRTRKPDHPRKRLKAL